MRLLVLLAVLLCSLGAYSQPCVEKAKEIAPVLSPETKQLYEKNLDEAFQRMQKDPDSEKAIWLARRIAYLGSYKEAIALYTTYIEKSEQKQIYNPRLYRHRGHRYITLRCFDDAIKDLENAAKLIKGKPDEVEPDGIPNAKNIPTSTLQSNIWYHLGLAYYLKGDFKKALSAYEEAEKVSTNPDMRVATAHWHYMTLRRLGKKDDAKKLVDKIPADLQLIENDDYYKLIKLYKGIASGEDLLREFDAKPDNVSKASLGYGLGNRYLYHKMKKEAVGVFQKILNGEQWASFGYIAAEVDHRRWLPLPPAPL